MRRCLLNDCNCNSQEPAMCCLDCGDRFVCPDRCPKRETDCCVGVIEDDSKRNTTQIQESKA
jgi:hypothetical protein